MVRFFVLVGVFFAFATGAEARTSHHHFRHSAHHYRHYGHHHHRIFLVTTLDIMRAAMSTALTPLIVGKVLVSLEFVFAESGTTAGYERSAAPRHAHLGGRPRAWCGWYMRQQVGGDPGPQYNLARSWAHYGSNAGGPTVGAIVVWRHHVGKIVGRENGQWIVQSGNDGHAVRTRARSLAGAIAFRNSYASM